MMGYTNLLVFVVYTGGGGGGVQSSFFFDMVAVLSKKKKHENSPHIAFASERGGYTWFPHEVFTVLH